MAKKKPAQATPQLEEKGLAKLLREAIPQQRRNVESTRTGEANMSEPEQELVEQTGKRSIWLRKPHAEKLLQVDLEQLNAAIAASQDRVYRLLDGCDLVANHV